MKRGLVRKFWIGATLLIIVLTAFAAGRNLIHAFKIRSQIRVLEREKSALRGEDRTRQCAYRTTQTGRFPRTIRPRALPHAAQGREGLYHQIIRSEGGGIIRQPYPILHRRSSKARLSKRALPPRRGGAALPRTPRQSVMRGDSETRRDVKSDIATFYKKRNYTLPHRV